MKPNACPKWLTRHWFKLAVITVVVAWLLNLGLGWTQLWREMHANPAEAYVGAGVFGDMFGAVNALFSGLSIIGIIYAIQQQDMQLRLARKEVRTAQRTLKIAIVDADKTKSILDEQQKHLALQNHASRQQMFENTFFNLLDSFIRTRSEIDIERNGKPIMRGTDALGFILRAFRQNVSILELANSPDGVEYLKIKYAEFYRGNGKNLGHYFRLLYNMFKFVDRSDIEDKNLYTDLVRAHLSDQEVALLFYNCLLHIEGANFAKYINLYSLLKHLKTEDVFTSDLKQSFETKAFTD